MSDMLDKMKDLLDGVTQSTPEEEVELNTGLPLLDAVERAIEALEEIVLYSTYGRSESAAATASDALAVIKALKNKYDEEVAIMEALTNPQNKDDDYDD